MNGVIFGKRAGEGTIKNALPDGHSDFVCGFGEEFGLIACLFVVMAFIFILVRSFSLIQHKNNMFILLATAGLIVQFLLASPHKYGFNPSYDPYKGHDLAIYFVWWLFNYCPGYWHGYGPCLNASIKERRVLMIAQTKFSQKAHIILATGGTGGHIFPADANCWLAPTDIQLKLITDDRGDNYWGLLGRVARKELSMAFRGKSLPKPSPLLYLMRGFCQAFLHLKRLRPDIVIGWRIPVFANNLAANLLGIKTILHEQNAVLGRANRLLAARADYIATAFEKDRNDA